MYDYTDDVGDVDIVFAGGGASACVTAGRLARAAPDLNILIIELGRNNLDDPIVKNPALFMAHLGPDSKTALFYNSVPSDSVGGREVVVPAGRILGGGSSINLSMYTRAQAADYDAWNTPGWSAKDMIPLCNKVETYEGPSPVPENTTKHGKDGPIKISDGGFRSPNEDAIMKTLVEMGYKDLPDINDFETIGGFMRIPRYVSRDGQRQDAAHCYIHPLLQPPARKNLHILLNTAVKRVIFDKTQNPPRAIGVECQSADTSLGQPRIVYAKKLVVVSAGALGSPQILERSGIGKQAVLDSVGIPVVCDLEGVGENYQDHHLVTSSYETTLSPEETLDSLATNRKQVSAAITSRDPQLGWNTIDVAGKLRPSNKEVQHLGPAFADIWKCDWEPHPGKPMMILDFISVFVGDPADAIVDRQYLTIGAISLYPYSRGSIHINSRDEGYEFQSGFLSQEADVKMQVWGYKCARAIARKLPFFSGEVGPTHPSFNEGSTAALSSLIGATRSTNIEYSRDDDDAIEAWIRRSVGTTWHSLGTCAMKPRNAGGVVDPELKVYGTQALKVADLSIAPENIGGNVGNTAFAIGEKAALTIAAELGIKMQVSG